MNLVDACLYNNLPKVKESILRGERDPKALLIACSKSLEMVEFLCSASGIVPDYKCLEIAIDTDSIDIFKFLIKHPSIDPCANEQYALRKACVRDKLEVVKILAEFPCTKLQGMLKMLYGTHSKVFAFLLHHPRVIVEMKERMRDYMSDEEFIKLRSQYLELFI